VLTENDERTEARRYMGLEIVAACRKLAGSDQTSEGWSDSKANHC